MLLAPVVLVGAVIRGGWRAGHLFEDQEATHIQLQALRTVHITDPFLASPILPLPVLLPLLSPSLGSGMGVGAVQTAVLTLTLPSLGPGRSLPMLKVRVYGWPESILRDISGVLSQPQYLGSSLPKGARSAEVSPARTPWNPTRAQPGYPGTQRNSRKGRARAASISLALHRLPATAPGAPDSSTIAGARPFPMPSTTPNLGSVTSGPWEWRGWAIWVRIWE
ncbi:hypothetical protein FIBSPDRAFT_958367 [Athelia psychrophila]|uniref:Uncharacterized protein n=1 Tax=Athelia psychrophila TaxID=1759441 RepID=A0A166ERE0_9AGAM|nr:hypothetical protein FIBSPDRAFT_958367 [Fibularhizoctonia sp. CBS 109695]